ncbi:MAG: ATP-grasp domain-containing protein [Bacteroidales bacterium]|nr:ATP-grasp domain-containing protein [Bacteroidales bacterium]
MAGYETIAVIYGSDSSEWEVSCRSGEYTASRIDDTKYDVYEIFARFGRWQLVAFRKRNSMRVPLPEGSRPEIDKTDFSVNLYGGKVKFDFAYIMQHGKPGETGQLQGYFEMLGIPFSTCSSFVSSLAFDKYACKGYLKGEGIVKLAPDYFVRKGCNVEEEAGKAVAALGLPIFVKPTGGGSSFGMSKVDRAEDLPEAIRFAFSEWPTVIIEKAIPGGEFTCAAYTDAGEVKTLPVIQIVSDNDYFDYDAKYNGRSNEICPAPIPDEVSDSICGTTAKIYAHLGCSGLVRMDYILAPEGLYFLEVNIIPGMTSASLVPKMVRAAGIDITEFLSTIIENG